MKRIEHVQSSFTKLPKISNIKIVSKAGFRKEKQKSIEKENVKMMDRLLSISREKSQNKTSLLKSIQNYEQYRKISRRNKSCEKKLIIHKS